MNLPPIRKPTTQHDLMRAMWEVIDRLQALQLNQSATISIQQTPNGVIPDVRPSSGGKGDAKWG